MALDEVVIPINGEKQWLWRAVDANGDTLDILVQKHRNAKATKRFLRRLIDCFGEPRVMVTDKLRSYIKPIRTLAPDADHRAHKGLNNHIKGSHPLPGRLLRNKHREGIDTKTRENIRAFQVTAACTKVSVCP